MGLYTIYYTLSKMVLHSLDAKSIEWQIERVKGSLFVEGVCVGLYHIHLTNAKYLKWIGFLLLEKAVYLQFSLWRDTSTGNVITCCNCNYITLHIIIADV